MVTVFTSWAFIALTTLLLMPVVHAGVPRQALHAFNWAFVNPSSNTFLAQCDTVQMKIISLANGTDNSVPPYSVASFEVGGVPDIQWNVSTDKNNIPWTIKHSSGAQVYVSIIDGNYNDGGFAGVRTVTGSSNTTCLRPDPVNPPVISQVNATGSIQACDHWGMAVTGGSPPYGAFIVADKGEIISQWNSTGAANDLAAVYKNYVTPGQNMILAVQDSRGVWGKATQAITVVGQENACKFGVESSWIPSNIFTQETSARASAEAQQRKTHTITVALAVVFSLLGTIVIGLAAWYWLRYRRSNQSSQTSFQAPAPPYDAEKALPIENNLHTRPSHSSLSSDNSRSPLVVDTSSMISGPMDLGRSASQARADDFGARSRVNTIRRPESFSMSAGGTETPVNDSPPQRTNSTSPFPPGRRPSRKAMEAAEERRLARERVGPPPALPSADYGGGAGPSGLPRRQGTLDSTYSRGPGPSRNPSAASTWRGGLPSVPGSVIAESEYDDAVDASDAGTIIIQHRDAGQPQVVVELPPAYMFDEPSKSHQSVPHSAVSPIEGGAGAAL